MPVYGHTQSHDHTDMFCKGLSVFHAACWEVPSIQPFAETASMPHQPHAAPRHSLPTLGGAQELDGVHVVEDEEQGRFLDVEEGALQRVQVSVVRLRAAWGGAGEYVLAGLP